MALIFTVKNLKLYNNEADGQFQIRYWDNDGKRKRNRVKRLEAIMIGASASIIAMLVMVLTRMP